MTIAHLTFCFVKDYKKLKQKNEENISILSQFAFDFVVVEQTAETICLKTIT